MTTNVIISESHGNDVTTFTKKIWNNVIVSMVEPTFSAGEWSAVIWDEYSLWIEAKFKCKQSAIKFAIHQLKKYGV